jgi:hypothetical protein
MWRKKKISVATTKDETAPPVAYVGDAETIRSQDRYILHHIPSFQLLHLVSQDRFFFLLLLLLPPPLRGAEQERERVTS